MYGTSSPMHLSMSIVMADRASKSVTSGDMISSLSVDSAYPIRSKAVTMAG